jgi:hypothetical protein
VPSLLFGLYGVWKADFAAVAVGYAARVDRLSDLAATASETGLSLGAA